MQSASVYVYQVVKFKTMLLLHQHYRQVAENKNVNMPPFSSFNFVYPTSNATVLLLVLQKIEFSLKYEMT
jgi:hypothetical protein